jgi:hypothetical protein
MSGSGAWGKKLVLREPTPEEIEEGKRLEKARKLRELEWALRASGTSLVNKIEALITARDGGVSSNYGSDEQYGVKGEWNTDVVNEAFEQWKALYGAVLVLQLRIHKLGPSYKTTGDRNKYQFNFIRHVTAGGSGRFNVHVDWSGS